MAAQFLTHVLGASLSARHKGNIRGMGDNGLASRVLSSVGQKQLVLLAASYINRLPDFSTKECAGSLRCSPHTPRSSRALGKGRGPRDPGVSGPSQGPVSSNCHLCGVLLLQGGASGQSGAGRGHLD